MYIYIDIYYPQKLKIHQTWRIMRYSMLAKATGLLLRFCVYLRRHKNKPHASSDRKHKVVNQALCGEDNFEFSSLVFTQYPGGQFVQPSSFKYCRKID